MYHSAYKKVTQGRLLLFDKPLFDTFFLKKKPFLSISCNCNVAFVEYFSVECGGGDTGGQMFADRCV